MGFEDGSIDEEYVLRSKASMEFYSNPPTSLEGKRFKKGKSSKTPRSNEYDMSNKEEDCPCETQNVKHGKATIDNNLKGDTMGRLKMKDIALRDKVGDPPIVGSKRNAGLKEWKPQKKSKRKVDQDQEESTLSPNARNSQGVEDLIKEKDQEHGSFGVH
jgi:hypothetical protein